MMEIKKTNAGYAVRKRCDECGVRISLKQESDELCILKCSQCGREYRFYHFPQAQSAPDFSSFVPR